MSTFTVFIIMVIVAIVGLAKMIYDTKKGIRSAFYYNTHPIYNCPNCGQKIPPIHIPKSFKQLLKDEWECQNCKKTFNRFGDEVKYNNR